MPKLTNYYPCPARYSLYVTCHTHGWTYLAPFAWDDAQAALEFAIALPDQSVDVKAVQADSQVRVTIESKRRVGAASRRLLDAAVIRSLGLRVDTDALFGAAADHRAAYRRLIEKGAGRLLRGATLWEDAAKTLFTTNCSWEMTEKMCERICSETFTAPAPSGRYPFPPPSTLVGHTPSELRQKMPIGYRDDYLKALAHRFAGDPTLGDIETAPLSYDDAYKRVSSLRGFGPYARPHLLLLVGHYERIPVDTVETAYIKSNHRCRDVEKFAAKHYRAWGRHQWWGYKLEKMLRRRNWLGD